MMRFAERNLLSRVSKFRASEGQGFSHDFSTKLLQWIYPLPMHVAYHGRDESPTI